jgi:hypothetical protein
MVHMLSELTSRGHTRVPRREKWGVVAAAALFLFCFSFCWGGRPPPPQPSARAFCAFGGCLAVGRSRSIGELRKARRGKRRHGRAALPSARFAAVCRFFLPGVGATMSTSLMAARFVRPCAGGGGGGAVSMPLH